MKPSWPVGETWRASFIFGVAIALAGCASVPAGDYFARPLMEAARPRAKLTARFRVEPPPANCARIEPPIVFLPALGITQHGWAGVTARLLACRARVLVDAPGIGESPEAEELDVEGVLAALEDVLDAVSPHAPLVLAGHSLGGAMAARLVARHPDRFAAVILVDAPLAPLTLTTWERLLLQPASWPPLLHLAGATAGVKLGLARVSGGGDRPSALDTALIARQWSDRRRRGAMLDDYRLFLSPESLRENGAAIERVRAPVLLVWGRDDKIVPLDVERDVAARLAKVTTVRERIVDGTGHMPPMTHAAETAQAIDEFLSALPAANADARDSAARDAAARDAAARDATARDSAVRDSTVRDATARDSAAAMRVKESPRQLHARDEVWGTRHEVFPLAGVNALFTLEGRTDLSVVAGVARGGVDPHFPVESGRVGLTAGATLRLQNGNASFAYLRGTAELEIVWRWAGGIHVDGTLLVDPRRGDVGGYAALGYVASALPWTRIFIAGGELPGDGARLLLGVELTARLTGLWW